MRLQCMLLDEGHAVRVACHARCFSLRTLSARRSSTSHTTATLIDRDSRRLRESEQQTEDRPLQSAITTTGKIRARHSTVSTLILDKLSRRRLRSGTQFWKDQKDSHDITATVIGQSIQGVESRATAARHLSRYRHTKHHGCRRGNTLNRRHILERHQRDLNGTSSASHDGEW